MKNDNIFGSLEMALCIFSLRSAYLGYLRSIAILKSLWKRKIEEDFSQDSILFSFQLKIFENINKGAHFGSRWLVETHYLGRTIVYFVFFFIYEFSLISQSPRKYYYFRTIAEIYFCSDYFNTSIVNKWNLQ